MKLTSFALAAVAALSACSMTAPQPNTPSIVTNVVAPRPGTGVVQAVIPTPVMAGASQGEPTQRLEVRMSDGKIQYIDTRSREIVKGDRIQLGEDGLIRKV
jgi:hypothetical protein